MMNRRLISQLNLTPFIDVMLVLLVVFMVMSSVAVSEMQIHLPASSSAKERERQKNDFVAVSFDSEGTLYCQGKAVSLEELRYELKRVKEEHGVPLVVLSADGVQPYEKIIHIMDSIRETGISKIMLSVEKQS